MANQFRKKNRDGRSERDESPCSGELGANEIENVAPVGFGLQWSGKAQSVALAQTPVTGVFRDMETDTVVFPSYIKNVLIEEDNLPTLKLLEQTLRGQVGIIYIDPPYNTGNDFGYCDNFRQAGIRVGSHELTLKSSEQLHQFSLENGRLHERWLSMMMPRLMAAWKLLRDDGIICISIDDNEIDKLRLMCSEVFGDRNFLGQVTILSNPRGRQAERHFAAVHEYLLVFARNAASVRLSGQSLTEEQSSEFKLIDGSGRYYRLLGLRQRGAASRQEDRPALHYPIYVDPASRRVSLAQDDVYSAVAWPKKSTGQPGRWMWGRDKVSENLDIVEARLITHRNEWDVFVRDFLCSADGVARTRKVSTLWMESELNYQNGKRQLKALIGEAPVDYPKPLALIKKILALYKDKNALVLDFFAGTGTTAQAVMEQNVADGGSRRFILVQKPEALAHPRFPTISALCAERVRKAIQLLPVSHRAAAVSDFKVLRIGQID